MNISRKKNEKRKVDWTFDMDEKKRASELIAPGPEIGRIGYAESPANMTESQGRIMARLNIEESIWSDTRFLILSKKFGEREAIGMLVQFWRSGAQFFKEGKVIPEDMFHDMDFSSELIRLGFARKTPDGIEVAGSVDHFSWMLDKKESASRAGHASWEARKKSGQDMGEISRMRFRESSNEIERGSNEDRTDIEPIERSLSHSLSHSLSKRENTTTTELVHDAPSAMAEATPPKLMPKAFPLKFESVDELLSHLSHGTTKRWMALYDNDKEFLRHECIKAFGWYHDNPKKKPKNRQGWSNALSSWLSRSWTRRAIETKGRPPAEIDADAYMEQLKREEREQKEREGHDG
jgi:hypothetical protein